MRGCETRPAPSRRRDLSRYGRRVLTRRIEDYALIGDCETAALVGADGSIDWLCWPRFDSAACFACLIGQPENGRWLLAPEGEAETTRRYCPDTMILETTFRNRQGVVKIVDFMPLRDEASNLVRIVEGLAGNVDMVMHLAPRFDYGRLRPWTRGDDQRSVEALVGPDALTLWTDVPVSCADGTIKTRFTTSTGSKAAFVLAYRGSHLPAPRPIDPHAARDATEDFWRKWASRCRYEGRWRDAVVRSYLTLKALTYRPTGGIVAAPTTSLPEKPGGIRNWDYRYCWLRDATMTLMALMDAGYYDEAAAWRDWLLRAVAGNPERMQIVYGLAGEQRLTEWNAEWLDGYRGSRPVTVGNAAFEQHQNDIFGEVADALHQARAGGLRHSDVEWEIEKGLLRHLERAWPKPDQGIWESRGPLRLFTHSKVMAWVAFDRAVHDADRYGLPGPVDRWRALRKTIHAEICSRGFDPELGSFVRSYGSKCLDASLLMIPLVGFLPPDDPRVLGTVRAIRQRLTVNGLLLRYDPERSDDGLPGQEGAFFACNFWLADNLILGGRREDGLALFERLLSLRNDVGLLSEECDPATGRMLGNFPQALSHLALVQTAKNLVDTHGPAARRAEG